MIFAWWIITVAYFRSWLWNDLRNLWRGKHKYHIFFIFSASAQTLISRAVKGKLEGTSHSTWTKEIEKACNEAQIFSIWANNFSGHKKQRCAGTFHQNGLAYLNIKYYPLNWKEILLHTRVVWCQFKIACSWRGQCLTITHLLFSTKGLLARCRLL